VVLADLVVNVVLLVATWLAGHGLRVSSDRRVAAELAADRAASVAVQEERARISRDLHDSLGHALTLITLQAGSARERTEDPVAVDALQTIETSGRQAVLDLHGFLELLEAAAPAAPGLAELPALVDGVRRSGLTVDLAVTAGPLPEGPSAAVYRVVQEGLTNALRHSDASHASVDVHREAASVVTVVTSSGHPTAPLTRGAGRGLVGLRERLAALGGSVESVATSEGWRLEARIPSTEM
jgi:signal transduction histidine kinase